MTGGKLYFIFNILSIQTFKRGFPFKEISFQKLTSNPGCVLTKFDLINKLLPFEDIKLFYNVMYNARTMDAN